MTLERMDELTELAAELISDLLPKDKYVDDIRCSSRMLEVPIWKVTKKAPGPKGPVDTFCWGYDEDGEEDDETQLREAIRYYFK